MKQQRVAIAADHRGVEMKSYIKHNLHMSGHQISWFDEGVCSTERVDYPPFAAKVAHQVAHGHVDAGILICGSGIGMAIVANRFKQVYAGLVWLPEVARVSREDDNTNILVLPSDFVSLEISVEICHAWFGAVFKGGRYQKRLAMIDQI